MLKTRITEQYGLKVPFINAGMAKSKIHDAARIFLGHRCSCRKVLAQIIERGSCRAA
jgi:hypothetical protein